MSLAKYSDTTDSGIEWLGKVPLHWNVVRLRHVAELNPSKSEVSDLDRELSVSFLPMEAVGDDGTIQLENTRSIGAVENGYTYFREGDVTLAKITPCFENGKGAIMRGLLNGIGFGTTELIVVRPRPEYTTSDYLHWLFMSSYFRRIGESTMYGAGGQKRVPDDFVRNFATAIPPLDEQKAISSFLDVETSKIDGLVSEQRRLIELLKEKRQAVISHAVTKGLDPNAPMKPSGIQWLGDVPLHWQVVRLGRLCNDVADGPHFSPKYVDEGAGGVLFLSARNVKVDQWDFDDVKYVSVEDCDEFDRRVVPEVGDVLYTKGGTTGIARVVDLSMRFQVWVHVAVLKIKKEIGIPEYVALALNSTGSYEQSQLYTRGATNQDLGLTRMVKIRLALPPIEEQPAIIKYLDAETEKFDKLLAEAERAIELLQERRTALISAAVTGKIDVRDYAPKAVEQELTNPNKRRASDERHQAVPHAG